MFFQYRFLFDFSSILGSFGEGFGRPEGAFLECFFEVIFESLFLIDFVQNFVVFSVTGISKIMLPSRRELNFYKFVFSIHDDQKHAKIIQKSIDFEVENREKSMKKTLKKTSFVFIDFSSIFHRFWRRFGRSWGALGRHLAVQN